MRTLVWALAGLLAVGGEGRAAEVTRVGPPVSAGETLVLLYRLDGPIGAGDGQRLGRLFAEDVANLGDVAEVRARVRSVAPSLSLELDSPGGDPEEGMRLGRWLRRHRGAAEVKSGEQCASACVLVLAGAVRRTSPGAVIVHRLALESTSPGQAGRAWLDLDASIRRYLARMNVPVALADMALEEPPESGRALTWAEKRRFLLEGWDPAFEEERISALARLYGVSSGEFRRRWAGTQAACGSEDLLERRILTLELGPGAADRGEKLRDAWNDCRWKAMGLPDAR
jgi:hypothetical protein